MAKNENEPEVTGDGFEIKSVDDKYKKRRTSKRKKKTQISEQNLQTESSIEDIKSRLPIEDRSSDVSFVPLVYKDAFNDDISGGGVDSDGHDLTSKGQLLNSITKVDDPTDDRTLDQISEELSAAQDFDAVLSEEQRAAQAVQFAIDPDFQKSSTDDAQSKGTNVPYMTTSDIENEINEVVNAADLGDLEAMNQFRTMMNKVKTTPINYGEPALERLGLQDYYPDVNMPLQVGTYSGSIVGSNPIFVAGGGLIPVGIIDARKRAMERAAADRVKKGEKLKELMLVPSAEQYQDKIHEAGLSIFNKYGEMTNWDYNKIMDMSTEEGRAFQKEYQGYRANAKRTIAINKQYEDVLKSWKTGNKYIPQHVMSAMEEWQSGMWEASSLDDSDMLKGIERTMQSYDNMTKDAEDLSKVIQKDQSFFGDVTMPVTAEDWTQYESEMKLIRSTNRYDLLRGGTFKFVPIERIQRLVDTKVNHKNYYNPDQSKLDMLQYVNDLISTEIMPKYIEANKGGGTRVTVNNAPKTVTQSNESRILGNQSTWKSGLTASIPMGDRAVASELSSQIGLEPKVDETGKFVNGEIRGSYSLTKDQNNGEQTYNFSEMRFIPQGSNERLSLNEYQDKIVKKNGLNMSFDDLVQFKVSKGISDNEFANNLINGSYSGIRFTPEEAWVLSRNDNSTANTKWNRKEYVQKYQQQDGSWQIVTMQSSPEVVSGSSPFNEVFAGVLDEGVEGGGVFAGFTVFVDYNLNNALGDLPAVDTQNTGASSVMKQENIQGNLPATQRVGGTGDRNVNTNPPDNSNKTIFN